MTLLAALIALAVVEGCAGPATVNRRPAEPDIRITPAPTQHVQGTATAFARQIVPTPTPPGLYIVKPGDTLSKIADTFATTIDEIMALNNLVDPNLIEVGQQLIIPSGASSTEAGTATPQEGETVPQQAVPTPEAPPEASPVPSATQ